MMPNQPARRRQAAALVAVVLVALWALPAGVRSARGEYSVFATKLANNRRSVDVALPWGVTHSGDYDLGELFDWMARIAK